ncbi:hypothetical protein GBA65_21465 (plasmid) [Rubrobacter marinus]|uniref:Uncharacterized protein n=1 Tax=Rubrobacter marinus TaxID=2653852 RepID=A0A6G8Q3I2_9ACTN|nr:hypothetical protein [Rubrobacter marinus]QIN81016.1 hypothetical protein GBA65_21465 [Rubrobacter marinus]
MAPGGRAEDERRLLPPLLCSGELLASLGHALLALKRLSRRVDGQIHFADVGRYSCPNKMEGTVESGTKEAHRALEGLGGKSTRGETLGAPTRSP